MDTLIYLERALAEARNAAEAHSAEVPDVDPFCAGNVEAIEGAIRAIGGAIDRLEAQPLLDGRTWMIPASGLQPQDRFVTTDGTPGEMVSAVIRRSGVVDVEVSGRDGVAYELDPAEDVEVTR